MLKDKIVVTDAVYDADLLADLYTVLLHCFMPPSTFFIEHSLLFDEAGFNQGIGEWLPGPLGTFLARHLRHVGKSLSIGDADTGGWEVWSRVSTYNSPSFGYLHVDNDELLRNQTGSLVSPMYGSILYVGPGSDLGGGETAFLSSPEGNVAPLFTRLPPENFTSPPFEFVSPKLGRLALFDGELPHAVMWTHPGSVSPRVTLLANFWPERISSVKKGVCGLKSINRGLA